MNPIIFTTMMRYGYSVLVKMRLNLAMRLSEGRPIISVVGMPLKMLFVQYGNLPSCFSYFLASVMLSKPWFTSLCE